MVFQDVNIPFLYVIIIINIWLFYSFSLNKHNEKVYNEVFMMNTRTLEQFDAMDVDMLAAVEGGNWGQCIVGTGSSALAGGLAGAGTGAAVSAPAAEGGGLGPIAGAAIGWDLGAISGAGLGWANFCQ
ncbi:hypothetical protein SMU82_06734 [Streptococcus mutans SM6]|nr:hypothetical protein SMU62_07870 [Streptococcus mutans M21]EMC23505.1 hypothetical protein SMU82_06734 [Streptococcus mutans SM6]EMP60488.1 hypothetical protein D818_08278 [Streptococcus mutans KK23]